MHSLNIIARQTIVSCDAAIEFNRAEELLEWRRLQNYLTLAIRYDARAVEDYSVVRADQIHKNDWQSCGLSPVRDHGATLPHLSFIERRGVYRNKEACAQLYQLIRRVVRV